MEKENPTLDEIREYWADDKFATRVTGVYISEGSKGHSVCELDLTSDHDNAQGNVMGGAIFTLADLALAVAANIGQGPTVAVENSIRFLAPPAGKHLVATCEADKMGRSMSFFTVDVVDELGTHVAIMTATSFRKQG